MQITDTDFKDIVISSFSIRQVIQKLCLIPAGGNYTTVKNRIRKLNLDTSHFRGQGWLRGQTRTYQLPNNRTLVEILVKGKYCNSYKLKRRLFKAGLKNQKCENCDLVVWLGVEIPLELHHRDGDTSNNEIGNLQILCPNCHALTKNYRGKNIQL